MLFNSIQFLLFFPSVVALYFATPFRLRWLVLLIASYYYYMSWEPGYVFLIGVTTVISYFSALKLGGSENLQKRKCYLMLCIFVNVGILLIFKYFNFFSESLGVLLSWFQYSYSSPALQLLLPVGISFYTFQSLSYVIDVYRGDIQPERHLGRFALFVSFFPQLIAGPIERASHLMPQLRQKHAVNYHRIVDGLRLMLWGFFKKIVIADRLAVMVDAVYSDPTQHSGVVLILATFFFAFQIYCDFSGYCDIAIGAAKVMGYNLSDNFNRPYFSRSIREFWRGWHITLYTWFRDYVYIPLGGSRCSKWRTALNIFIVFAITGLWHGAAWTFIVWGMLHGTYLIVSFFTKGIQDRIINFFGLGKSVILQFVRIFITFNLVSFAWIFFRANSITDAFYIVQNLFVGVHNPFAYLTQAALQSSIAGDFGITIAELWIALALILFMELIHILQKQHVRISDFLTWKPVFMRWAIYYILILLLMFFGHYGYSEFIYFQF